MTLRIIMKNKTYYVARSSVFDSFNYDAERIKQLVNAISETIYVRIGYQKNNGQLMRNLPKVVYFKIKNGANHIEVIEVVKDLIRIKCLDFKYFPLVFERIDKDSFSN